MKGRYLYGPVFSRRLGRSLGVDIVPYKTCSLDCIYCECGSTTDLTLERKEYFPTNDIIQELHNFLASGPVLDYITFAGSGEPTLHLGIGTIISFLKNHFPQYRTAILTNATLLNNDQVINDIKQADLIVPSLDGISSKIFKQVNRPHPLLKPDHLIKGIKKLRTVFTGELWLEIFIVPGINDYPEELDQFKKVLKTIHFEKIQLNSLDRPGTVDWIKKGDLRSLENIASYLGPGNIEIVSRLK